MVASISARGNAAASLRYYDHLQRDDYYSREGEPPGRWAGRGAERLSLVGPVTHAEFQAALQGVDPKTGERLAQAGGRGREHSAGWDMTFSAPKSVSVLWALSEGPDRAGIEQAHRSAVLAGTAHLEATAGRARRGRGGATRERTAGLLMAQFDHHTSRDSDPQLHTHAFIFNLAPRLHQLIVLRRKVRGRAQPTHNDRWFLVQMYRWFPSILKVVTIVQPETLVRWHRAGCRRYWRWKSKPRGGRPRQSRWNCAH
jgi:conjugative relaxase-like TrwC/TraI family protein